VPSSAPELDGEPVTRTDSRVRVVRTLPELARLADELTGLAAATNGPATTYFEGVRAWLAARPGRQPASVLVHRGPELVAAAHLARHRERTVWRLQQAGTEGEPFRLLAVDEPAAAVLNAGIRAELAALPGRWKLMLTDLPAADRHRVETLAGPLPVSAVATALDTPLLRMDGDAGLNRYLSRNVRAAVAKARNRILADGRRYEVRWLSRPELVVAAVAEVVDTRRARNLQLGRALDDPVEVATFRATVAGHARAGRVRLVEVRIDARLAAYALCLHTGDTLWVYSNAVSPDFTRYSAGTIANAEVVRGAHADPGIRVLNWGRGIQRYKVSGPVTIAGTQTLTAWSSEATRRLLRLGRRLR